MTLVVGELYSTLHNVISGLLVTPSSSLSLPRFQGCPLATHLEMQLFFVC